MAEKTYKNRGPVIRTQDICGQTGLFWPFLPVFPGFFGYSPRQLSIALDT
jgi:hypothetical protein